MHPTDTFVIGVVVGFALATAIAFAAWPPEEAKKKARSRKKKSRIKGKRSRTAASKTTPRTNQKKQPQLRAVT